MLYIRSIKLFFFLLIFLILIEITLIGSRYFLNKDIILPDLLFNEILSKIYI